MPKLSAVAAAAALAWPCGGAASSSLRRVVASVPRDDAAINATQASLGVVSYFNASACPTGWSAFTPGEGRLFMSAPPGSDGMLVGEPLSNLEVRAHNHSVRGAVYIGWQQMEDNGGNQAPCSQSGSYYPEGGSTNAVESELPLAQLLACRFDGSGGAPAPVFPAGGLFFLDPTTALACPEGTSGRFTQADARFLLPWPVNNGGSAGRDAVIGQPLTHIHNFSWVYTRCDTYLHSLQGGSNTLPARPDDYTGSGTADAADMGLPYISLQVCLSTVPAGTPAALPPSAVYFMASPAGQGAPCPSGWKQNQDYNGRFLSAVPAGGSPGLSFGGAPVKDDFYSPSHAHSYQLPFEPTHYNSGAGQGSGGQNLPSWQCAGGYMATGNTGSASAQDAVLPYYMLPLCGPA